MTHRGSHVTCSLCVLACRCRRPRPSLKSKPSAGELCDSVGLLNSVGLLDTGATGRAPVRPYIQLVPCRVGVREPTSTTATSTWLCCHLACAAPCDPLVSAPLVLGRPLGLTPSMSLSLLPPSFFQPSCSTGRVTSASQPLQLSTSTMNKVVASCAALVSQLVPVAAVPVGTMAQPPVDGSPMLPTSGSMMIAFTAIAVMLTMINLLALCGSCFGGKDSEPSSGDDSDDADNIVACEAPDANQVSSVRAPCRVCRDPPCPVPCRCQRRAESILGTPRVCGLPFNTRHLRTG